MKKLSQLEIRSVLIFFIIASLILLNVMYKGSKKQNVATQHSYRWEDVIEDERLSEIQQYLSMD